MKQNTTFEKNKIVQDGLTSVGEKHLETSDLKSVLDATQNENKMQVVKILRNVAGVNISDAIDIANKLFQ